MSSSNFQVWLGAVLEDGQRVMYRVTTILYQGGRLSPDRYWQKRFGSDLTYKKHFNSDQRLLLESCDWPGCYDIDTAAEVFDISLHWAVQQKLCGLNPSMPLYKNLANLVKIRNNAVHYPDPAGISSGEIKEKLYELLEACTLVLDTLEDYVGTDLSSTKTVLHKSINKRLYELCAFPSMSAARQPTLRTASRLGEGGEELSTMGKVAVTVGVAGVAVVAAMASHFSDENKNRKDESNKNKTSRNKEECSVM